MRLPCFFAPSPSRPRSRWPRPPRSPRPSSSLPCASPSRRPLSGWRRSRPPRPRPTCRSRGTGSGAAGSTNGCWDTGRCPPRVATSGSPRAGWPREGSGRSSRATGGWPLRPAPPVVYQPAPVSQPVVVETAPPAPIVEVRPAAPWANACGSRATGTGTATGTSGWAGATPRRTRVTCGSLTAGSGTARAGASWWVAGAESSGEDDRWTAGFPPAVLRPR